MSELRLQMSSDPRSLAHIREIVQAFVAQAGLRPEQAADAVLAVHEACTNVCLHAYEEGESGPMGIEAKVAANGLEIMVWDGGKPVLERPRTHPGTGYGHKLIKALSDGLTIEGPGEDGTRVRMVFALPDEIGG